MFFSDTRVPASNLLGGEGEGMKNTMKRFEMARPRGHAVGGPDARGAGRSIVYATERKEFGKPIAAHQLVAAMIANIAMLLDASRLMCQRVFGMIDAGVRCDLEASMAQASSPRKARVAACREAVQLHGGSGITKEFMVEKYLARGVIIIPIPDGTTEIQRLFISAQADGRVGVRIRAPVFLRIIAGLWGRCQPRSGNDRRCMPCL
ncbi:acyl-CoA dehydrogenase family protein [Cupriavidus basilensis]